MPVPLRRIIGPRTRTWAEVAFLVRLVISLIWRGSWWVRALLDQAPLRCGVPAAPRPVRIRRRFHWRLKTARLPPYSITPTDIVPFLRNVLRCFAPDGFFSWTTSA